MPSFEITQDNPAKLIMLDFNGSLTLKITLRRGDPATEKDKVTYPIFALGKGKRTQAWFDRAMAGERPGSVRESELFEVALRNDHLFLEVDPHGGSKKTIPNIDLGPIGGAAAIGVTVTFNGRTVSVGIDGHDVPVTSPTFLQQNPGVPVALTIGFPHLEGEGVNQPLIGATVTWEAEATAAPA